MGTGDLTFSFRPCALSGRFPVLIMFNAFLYCSRKANNPPQSPHTSETRRNQLAASFKARIEQQLIAVKSSQSAMQSYAESPKAAGQQREASLQPRSVETSAKPLSLLREKHRLLQTDRFFSPRAHSTEHERASPAQRYGKTLVSLELGLHLWQEGEL